MDSGWIKVYRKLTEKSYYKKSEYVHLWIHILIMANREPNEWLYKGKTMKVQRGQLITSRRSLSRETGIKETNIERILKCYENAQQIGQQNMFTSRLITVINYDGHQKVGQQNGQQMDSKWTASGQQVDTNNKNKNERTKELKNNTLGDFQSPVGDSFEIFWKAYPRKIGKGAAKKIWLRIKPNNRIFAVMLSAIDEQRRTEQWQKDGGQFIPHPATWLNQERWQDETRIAITPVRIKTADDIPLDLSGLLD